MLQNRTQHFTLQVDNNPKHTAKAGVSQGKEMVYSSMTSGSPEHAFQLLTTKLNDEQLTSKQLKKDTVNPLITSLYAYKRAQY